MNNIDSQSSSNLLSSTGPNLIRELARAPPLTLPPYQGNAIRELYEEINFFHSEIQKLKNSGRDDLGSPYIVGNVAIQHTIMERNRRYILAYLMNRLQRIQDLRWEVDSQIPETTLNNFGEEEGSFLVQYDQILNNYMEEIEMNVTQATHIPTDLYIEVRVLQDCELEVLINNKKHTLLLKKNSTHHLKRADVEPLIRSGHLVHITI